MKPLLKTGKEKEELEGMEQRIKELEENLQKEEKLRKELEDQSAKLVEEKNGLFQNLESAKGQLSEAEDRLGLVKNTKKQIK